MVRSGSWFSGWAPGLVWLGGLVYAALVMTPHVGAPVRMGLVFNEMLSNLLHERFDLSPATVGGEAFERGGRSYAYFGVFCALLRAPLLLAGRMGVDMTGASILVAAALSLAARLGAASLVLDRFGAGAAPRWAVLAAAATNGESIQYLHPSLYQEVVSWGCALAAVFVWLALRMVLGAVRRRGACYAAMAGVAGLALLCRVSFGLGLYCALSLMLAVELWSGRRALALGARMLAPAAAILVVFAGLAGGVNTARWGDPLSFVPLRYQKIAHRIYPDRAPRLQRYGEVNIRRVPFALQYYFAPVWGLTDRRGDLIFQAQQADLFEDVEAPPAALPLSDPVICLLAGTGVFALAFARGGVGDRRLAIAALAGLCVPAGLMLAAISLTFRYRMEFYPGLDLAAWLGLAALAERGGAGAAAKYASPVLGALAVAGMAAAAVGLLAYALMPFGPATDLITARGWGGIMVDRLEGRDVYRGHLTPDGRRLPLER